MDTATTYTAVIEVVGIRPPSGRGKSYTVDTAEGTELSIWPDKLGLLRTNETYQVEVTDNEKNGRLYHNITGTPRHLGPYRAAKNTTKAEPATTPQPPTNGKKMEQPYYRSKPRDPAEQKQIWVCAMLCRDMESGRGLMSEAELIERGQMHARVWDELFSNRGGES